MSRRSENKEEKVEVFKVKVLRANEFTDKNGNDTTFFDMEVNGVKIFGCRFMTGKNGDFVSFPSQKGKDGKYYNHAWVDLPSDVIADIDKQLDDILK